MFIHDLPGEIGVAEAVPLEPSPLPPRKVRLHIVALGDVGATMLIGLRLLGGDVITSCGIYDLNRKNLERLEMEINQIQYPDGEGDLPAVEIITEDRVFDCDVFVFCATKGIPPVGSDGDVRMAQFAANRGLAVYFAEMAARACFKGLVCIVSDPVDPLCKAFLQVSGLRASQIQGFGLGVMNGRARYYACKDGRFASYLAEGRVYGPHGEDLVVANSLVQYDDSLSRDLTTLVVRANIAVRNLGYKPFIAPAFSSAAISIIFALRGSWHYGSIWLGSCSEGAFLGVRNRFYNGRVEYEDVPVPPALYKRIKKAYLNLCKLS